MASSKKTTDYSRTDCNQLIEKFQGIVRNDLKKYSGTFDYYELKDGRLLIVDPVDGTGTMYESEKSLREVMDEFDSLVAEKGQSHHVLKGVFSKGINFPSEVENYVNEFSRLTNISKSKLDYSVESLKIVDQAIQNWERSDMIAKLYAPLIAYTGEVIRTKLSGEWQIKKVEEGIEEPYILCGDKLYSTFVDLFKEFNESDEVSVHTVVLAEINKYLLNPKLLR